MENGSFKVVGQVIAMSILQEGPPPAFIANWVYHYLCTPDVTAISLIDDDIVNPDIRTLVKRVKEVNIKEELQAIFQEDTNMDVLMNTGFTSTISLEKKDTIVRYRPVQYPKMCFIVVLFRAVAFCVLCQLWFAVAKSYDCPKLSSSFCMD